MPVADAPHRRATLQRRAPRAEPLVWLCGAAVVLALGLLLGLLALLLVRGAGYFWPEPVVLLHSTQNGSLQLGVVLGREERADGTGGSLLIDRGAAPDSASPLAWIDEASIERREYPTDALVFERDGRASATTARVTWSTAAALWWT